MAQKYSLNRDSIPAKYKWNLNDIYPSWEAWDKDYAKIEGMMDQIAKLKGTLAKGAKELTFALKLREDMDIISYKVYQYPALMKNLDTRNQEVGSKLQKVQILFSKYATATSWFSPELLTIPEATMKKWIAETPDLKDFKFGLEDMYRMQSHVLSEDKENLLSFYSQLSGTPASIYSELSTSDIKFPTITPSSGEKITLTPGAYSNFQTMTANQADRKMAFEAHFGAYTANANTYASIYNGIIQKDWASAQARYSKSCVEAALEGNNIPIQVYENLVNTVKNNTSPLQRYLKLRKKVLKLTEYHAYDGSISLTDFKKTYAYEDAKKMVQASIAPLGKDYQTKMEKAVSNGWLDVFEATGKRSGAFSSNVYGVHPYMLLNYNETLYEVYTLAHELGHTLHTLLANENQPFSTSDYTIFVAEVASTFNERLLLDYMLKNTTDTKERIALLNQAITGIVGTFYTQAMFADFELQAHQLAEDGKPINVKALDDIMTGLLDKYYGDAVTRDPQQKETWIRIAHFFRSPFYVYQYATCYASSAQLYKMVTTGTEAEKKKATDNYLNLLKSGGNDFPMEQLKKAGVDLSKPETVKAVIDQMDDLVTQLEKELDKLK
ncbi:MAG: oligoendopeptidase F [Bacteroidetes bacterium]|nr:oligoendopeptidase F [Bacteroidota bacterium]